MSAAAVATAPKSEARFQSKAELREVLERLLTAIDDDPEVGPSMRSTRVPHRFVYPDVDLVCNITASEEGEHCLRWSFSDDVDWDPALTLEMSSEVANRYLQGRENLAIAIARGRIRTHGNARAALSFLPASRGLMRCYRSIVEHSYPHLFLD
ncbi:MAG: hypothetical protein AABM29_09955 [Actinomycetota bacterium]